MLLDYGMLGNLYCNICEDNYIMDISRLGESLHTTAVRLFMAALRQDPLTPDDIDGDEVGTIHAMYILSHILEKVKNDVKFDDKKSAIFNRWIPEGFYTNFIKRTKYLAKELYDKEISPRDLVYRQVADRNANEFILP